MQRMTSKLAAITLTALLGAPISAIAIPITYQIKFTVLSGVVTTRTYPEPSSEEDPTETQEDATGNVYFGLFAVDDEILKTDGINKPGQVEFFYIQMEHNIWGYNLAVNNSFEGFRGPGCGFCESSPGFDVIDGRLTNLRGGVYGEGDEPFVDFTWSEPNTFNARGATFHRPGANIFVGGYNVSIQGTMEIFRVPEPGALPLFGAALLVLTLGIRRVRN
jgi:hypothetical protein